MVSLIKVRSKNVLFVHIPRTGGTWINTISRDVLKLSFEYWEHGRVWNLAVAHHLLAHHFRAYGAPRIDYIFSIVRHPIPYYESVWRVLGMNTRWRNRTADFAWHPHKTAAELWIKDFNGWVERIIANEPAWYTRIVEGYVGPEGSPFCNHIGRTRSLVDDFSYVLSECGLNQRKRIRRILSDVAPINSSNKNRELIWNHDTKNKVLDMEKRVIRRFYSDVMQKLPKNMGR